MAVKKLLALLLPNISFLLSRFQRADIFRNFVSTVCLFSEKKKIFADRQLADIQLIYSHKPHITFLLFKFLTLTYNLSHLIICLKLQAVSQSI